ncbi:MAG TPA: acyltransferase [Candidatus Dormibacteraeota bacterium]|nr:acyltransferase [Candidatus Dormibacteraeota bacterium]
MYAHRSSRRLAAPTESASPRRQRLPELDLLRAIALLAVVFIHAGSWLSGADVPPDHDPVAAAIALARFCVPAFLFASGLALYRSHGRPADPLCFLRRRWLRILVPWLVWAPVYAAADVLLGRLSPDPKDVAVWFAYGGGHLYFLLLIAQLSLLLPALPTCRRWLVGLAALVLAAQLALDALHTYGPPASGALAWPYTYLTPVEAPFWAGWFLLGCLAGWAYDRHLTRLAWLWPLSLAATVASSVAVLMEGRAVPEDWWRQGTNAFLWPAVVLQGFTVALTLLWGGRRLAGVVSAAWLWRPVRGLSQHSLGVYVIHVLLLDLLGALVGGWPPVLRIAVLLAGGLGLAYLATRGLATTRPGALAVGEQRSPVEIPWLDLVRAQARRWRITG